MMSELRDKHSIKELYNAFSDANAKWKKAGKPKRSLDQMKIIYEQHCDGCEFKMVSAGITRCQLCGCCVSSNRQFLNKLLYATEGCPYGQFPAEVVLDMNGEPFPDDVAAIIAAASAKAKFFEVEEKKRVRDRKKAAKAERKKKDKPDDEQVRRAVYLGWREKENTDPLSLCDRFGEPASLRDLWKGCSAFLVGGGPSLENFNYHLLAQRGIASLGINNVAGLVPVKAFTCSDPSKKFHHGIWLDPALMKIVPRPRLRDHIRVKHRHEFLSTPVRVRDCPNVWGYERNSSLDPLNFLTTDSASWGRNDRGVAKLGGPKCIQTFFLGLRLMHYLGCRRVYLLGVDFRMDSENGKVYAFSQSKHQGGQLSNNNSYRNVVHYLEQIRPVLDDAGMQVFNCNPQSGLKLWQHVDFEMAVDDCRGHVPEGVFDLQGWYEKTDRDEYYEDGQRG